MVEYIENLIYAFVFKDKKSYDMKVGIYESEVGRDQFRSLKRYEVL